MGEYYNPNGLINRDAKVDLFEGAFATLDTDGKAILATASAAAGVFTVQEETKAGGRVALKVVGSSAGTITATATAGTYTVGQVVYLAADGKVATTGTVKIGVYLGEAKTTTADSRVEIAPQFRA